MEERGDAMLLSEVKEVVDRSRPRSLIAIDPIASPWLTAAAFGTERKLLVEGG